MSEVCELCCLSREAREVVLRETDPRGASDDEALEMFLLPSLSTSRSLVTELIKEMDEDELRRIFLQADETAAAGPS